MPGSRILAKKGRIDNTPRLRLEYDEVFVDTVVQRAWPGIVGQDSSKHGKHASSHDKNGLVRK